MSDGNRERGKKKSKEKNGYSFTVRVFTQNEIQQFQICFQDFFVVCLLPTVKLYDLRSRERNLSLLSPIMQ